MKINVGLLPKEIRESQSAVLWRSEEVHDDENGNVKLDKHGKPKKTKPPYQVKAPNHLASTTDPSTWASFTEACAVVEEGKADGAGVVLRDGMAGLDLDHCRDPVTGTIEPWALDIVHEVKSYTEVSPSLTGLRIFAHGTLPPGGRKKGPIEMYDSASGRYLTVTGNHLEGTPLTIEDRTTELAALHAKVFGANGDGAKPVHLSQDQDSSLNLSDAELIEKAKGATNGAKFSALWEGNTAGYPSPSEADLALCALLAFWTGADAARIDHLFRRSGLIRPKWDEQHGEKTYGGMTIVEAISGCTDVYSGSKCSHMVMPPAKPTVKLASTEEMNTIVTPPEFSIVTPSNCFITKYIEHMKKRTDAPPQAQELMALGILVGARRAGSKHSAGNVE